MMKKGISMLLSVLMMLSVMTLAPRSAFAEDTSSAISEEGTPDSDTAETEAPVPASTETPTEESMPVNYPVITNIQNLDEGTEITWDTYDNNTIYRVYYRKAAVESDSWDEKYGEVEWIRLAQVKGNSYVHSGPDDSELGIYTVRCVDENGFFLSDYNHDGWENRYFASPVIRSLTNTTEGVKISWERNDYAEDYLVYRKTNIGWQSLTRTSAAEYTDTAVVSGLKYTYTLRMVTADEDETFISGSNSGASVTYVAAPKITSVVNTESGARITWPQSAGAVNYRAYYKDGSDWHRMTTQSGVAYTDTTVKDGETRVYTVRCVDNNGNFTSDFYRTGYTNTYISRPVIKSVIYKDGSYTVTWTGNSAVPAYRVFRVALGSNELPVIADSVSDKSFVDSSAEKDEIYAYSVCAVNDNGEPVSARSEISSYYKNGSPVSNSSAAGSSFSAGGSYYRFYSGQPYTGYAYENGTNFFYDSGARVEQNWFKKGQYERMYNQSQWLYELMSCTGEKPRVSEDDGEAIFALAMQRKIITSYSSNDYTAAVDRLFVARTLVKAMGYKKRVIGTVSDSSDSDLSTVAYYGYFLPDDKNKLYPEAKVTASEFDSLISELRLYKKLHGRNLLVFGDSIMYGSGNAISSSAWEGIAEMIGKKYNMKYKEYTVPGAVMGKSNGKSHIPDQVRKAKDQSADLIIFNGGTNDIWHDDISLGSITGGYDMSSIPESNYTNGFETTAWLMRKYWGDVPIIYVRSHKMGLGSQANQISYGERALALCKKWDIAGIDLYNLSDLNGTNRSMCDRYTFDNDDKHRGIHPNAFGYAKYYLPYISQSMAALFHETLLGDADGDGSVTAIDVTYIQRYIAGMRVPVTEDVLLQGDVDGNGELDITDATWIQRSLSEMVEPYAIGA